MMIRRTMCRSVAPYLNVLDLTLSISVRCFSNSGRNASRTEYWRTCQSIGGSARRLTWIWRRAYLPGCQMLGTSVAVTFAMTSMVTVKEYR